MSKHRKCMQQVPDITTIAAVATRQVLEYSGNLLRCGILLFAFASGTGCDSQSADKGISQAPTAQWDKSNPSRILRRGLSGEPRTMDPQLADDTFSLQVVRDLYEGLTAEDRYGRVVPGAASSWTVDASGTIYTFRLRPDAKWSNGDRTVAPEFVAGLRRAVDPQTASGSAALLAVIKGANDIVAGRKKVTALGVTAIGESSVRIELEHPAPFVLQILSQPVAAPVHLGSHSLSEVAQSRSGANVSNGAYTLISRVTGSSIELARNKYYWDVPHVPIERVRYVNVESEATELREYIAGQLDMTFTIPMSDLNRISQKNGAEIQTAPILGTLYLALNVSEPPLKDSRDLRQALSMAVDRDLISKDVMMGVTPAYSFVARGTDGYIAPEYEWAKWPRERRLTYARYLLARSGYSTKNPTRLRLYFNSEEIVQRIMIAVAGNWKQNLGLDAELVSDEFRVFLTGRKDRRRWDVLRMGWYADYADPASFLEVFARDNSQNDPAYNSAQFNDLIDAARIEPQPDKRIMLLERSEEILLNDYPIIPIYFYEGRRLVKPYLGGAEITPLNRTYSKHLFWKNIS
jgi:oligopeptide transport system substrate-binding protein